MRDWNERRAKLSHDLVKNRLIPATSRMINIVNGRIEADPVETFNTSITVVWAEANPSLRFLFESAESELSPRNHFLVEPLINCPPSTMEWLPELIHDLWLERHNVRGWCNAGNQLVADVEAAIHHAADLLKGGNDIARPDGSAVNAILRLQEKSIGLSTHLSLVDNRLLI
jgi:hypothetical protein